MWSVLMLAACSGEPLPGDRITLDPVARLERASLAVRGVRPTVSEIEAVRTDPDAIHGLVYQWLVTPEFGATIRDMWAEILLVRNDTFNQLPALGALSDKQLNDIYLGESEEPLQLVQYIVQQDRPFTEIVTADYLLTDEITAKIYGVPYDPAQGGWQVSAWPDERPRAGLLSSGEVWRRWESDGSNFNRGRANMVAGRLLCEPFETRDIALSAGVDIADPEAVAEAVRDTPECVACHQSLDPMAAYFWGYKRLLHRNYVADSINAGCEWDWSTTGPEFGIDYLPEDYCYPVTQYNPASEDDWQDYGLRPPAYFGEPVGDAADLGRTIAADPRFAQCMARQFAGYLTQTDFADVPFERAAALQQVFVESGFDAKALVAAVVLDPSFATTVNPDDPTAGLETIRPEQYARTLEDLTGFRWFSAADPSTCDDPGSSDVQRFGTQCWGDVDLSDSDVYGFRSMSGGVDGKVMLRPVRTITPTKTLVTAQLAGDAAGYVVDRDFAVGSAGRRLLGQVEPTTTVAGDEGRVRGQIAWLHERVLGELVAADSAVVDDDLGLFELGSRTGGPAGGWKLLLTALFQDPRMMFF